MNTERYSRQQDIVPAERIAQFKATVIGVGAIGRQVALQLTAIGISRLQLIDHDVVETSNLASQGYREKDLGRLKVEATAEQCKLINSGLDIEAVAGRFRRSRNTGEAIFCCVDSIETRRLIWKAVKNKAVFFCDGRMSAETLRVITACDSQSRRNYPETLFSPEEAYAGPCTAKTTIYCANIAAGFMVAQFTKYLRQVPVDQDVQVNLLSMEMSAEAAFHN